MRELMWVLGAALSVPAVAADVLPAEGLVEILPVGDVLGDGSTQATVHVLALLPTGAPMVGLKLRAEVAGGMGGELTELGDRKSVV